MYVITNFICCLQFLCDRPIPDPRSAFPEGQSVIAKVTEVDHDRKRFLLSLRMNDCYHGNTEIGINLLRDYLQEFNVVMETYTNKKGNLTYFSFKNLILAVKINFFLINDYFFV